MIKGDYNIHVGKEFIPLYGEGKYNINERY